MTRGSAPKCSISRPFYILGEVTHPGEYPYTNNLTVLNAVATAGALPRSPTRPGFMSSIRGADVEEQVSLTGGTPVQPGDTVRIAKAHSTFLAKSAAPG